MNLSRSNKLYFEKAKIQTNKVKKTIRIKRKECRINQKSALKREFSLRKGKVEKYMTIYVSHSDKIGLKKGIWFCQLINWRDRCGI